MTYSPHSGASHGGGALDGSCGFCRDHADDHVRRLLGLKPRSFYTSVSYRGAHRLLTGPFGSAADAIADLPRAKDLATRDPRHLTYGYGVASSLVDVSAKVIFGGTS